MSMFRSRRTVDEAAARIARARLADLGSARGRIAAPVVRSDRAGWIPAAPPLAPPRTPAVVEPDPLADAVQRYWRWEDDDDRAASSPRPGRHRARTSSVSHTEADPDSAAVQGRPELPLELDSVGRLLRAPDLPADSTAAVPGDHSDLGSPSPDSGPLVRLGIGRPHLVAVVLALVVGAVVTGATALAARPETEPVESTVVATGTPLPGADPSADADDAATGDAPDGQADGDAQGSGEIVVHVAGKVATPGVLTLPGGSRVIDAIDAAGGALDGVDLAPLNLARVLADGEQILVGVEAPPPGGPDGGGSPGGPGSDAGGLVDLNSATAADLDTLPGIGPTLAQRILDWRTENGRFSSVDELREITGIGERTFADLEPLVTV